MIDLNTPLKGLPLAVIDVETTGLEASTCHVVEIAIVHVEIGDVPPRLIYSSKIRPTDLGMEAATARGFGRTVLIPEALTAIHGITNADVADAPTWAEAWPEIVTACEGRALTAHNVPFDSAFVGAECLRAGVCDEESARLGGRGWLCTQVPAKKVDRFESSKRLVDVARRRGIVLDAHGAAGDAMTAALLATKLWRQAASKCETLADLLRWQHAEALHQEAEFVAYKVRVRATGARPECRWHELLGADLPFWPEPKTPTAPCPHCRKPVTTAIGKGGRIEKRDDNGVHDCDEGLFNTAQHTTPPELP